MRKTASLAGDRAVRWFGLQLLRAEAKHVFGPLEVPRQTPDLVATCVVRNGALHVRSFIEHHQATGVQHIVFLDNGSTDGTVDLMREYGGVTVLQTSLPYRWFEDSMKEYLSRRFCRDRWNLCVDIDELWSYPFAQARSLDALVGYLDAHGFDTVVCQMLDMFSDVPLEQLGSRPDDRLPDRYPWYDIAHIEKAPYRFGPNDNPDIRMHFGGIRQRVFGTRNTLTKAALVKVRDDMELYVDHHFNTPARNADVTGVLMHFPFVDRFAAKVAEAVASDRYLHSAQDEYRQYHRSLRATPSPTFLAEATASRFTTVDRLLEQGFLVASERYRTWAAGGLADSSLPG